MDYNATLNLPQTDFSMKAALPQREPIMVQSWEDERRYYKMIEKNEGKPLYVLHDGPPYANGDIHLGTALNKSLKDIIVRSKNMSGFKSPYIPGWDTHGLPIELKALKKVGVNSDIDPVELRKHCKDFALFYMENQKNQFKRLGVLGDFDNPYLTLVPEFEAKQIEIFGEMAKKGYIYKGLKPVYWCAECGTALAEAEIEYAQDPCYSIYVKFPLKDDVNGAIAKMGVEIDKTYVVIWTTTTWTLPGNVAICLGPNFEYAAVKANGEYYIIAKELVEATMQAAKIEEYEIVGTANGKELDRVLCRHPFLNRDSMVILGDHVTLESGTGCVHTAPGHGVDDFEVVTNHYPELPIIVPVDNAGKMTELAGFSAGLTTEDAGRVIAKHLTEQNLLLATTKMIHQYPHCWRCKNPILFRATEQWFCSVDGFKDKAVEAIKDVQWIPSWGEDRMTSMVVDRKDWCISRQRTWGVPIPVFYCNDCGKYHIDDVTIKAVSELFRAEGADAWYKKSAEEILPQGTKCPHCSSASFRKETDIMDVWFDSGVTHAAVLEEREGLKWPCDLYLEGGDQFRGWFQSSLLTSVAWRGVAPYKAVCTHGWVVDGEGRKMSKSLGNGILAEEIVNGYGADILRLWVASSDYHADIRISKEILKQLSEVYRKIRNTARYILGNLNDFNPDTDMVAAENLFEEDRWAVARIESLTKKVRSYYDSFEFHLIFHGIHNFCTVDMSNFYLDFIKDRLYAEAKTSPQRRAAQTAIYKILTDLTLLITPILAFTAEEVWANIPKSDKFDAEAAVFNDMPAGNDEADEAFMQKWERIREIRNDVNKALELARAEKLIGKSLEAKITLHCEGELNEFVKSIKDLTETVFIVSEVEIVSDNNGTHNGETEGLSVTVSKADGEKCERCWKYSTTVGKIDAHKTLCSRCAEVVEA